MTGQLFNFLLIAGIVPVLIAQPVRAEVVQVTGVEVNPTDNSLQVILETSSGKPLQVLTTSYGATFVANIINTQLALSESNTFRSNNPTKGIAAVTITQQSGNSIRVSVISKAGVPTAEITQSDRGLVLSVTTITDTRAETPAPTPETLDEEPTPTDETTSEPDETTQEPTPTDGTTPEQAEGDGQSDENADGTTSEQAEGDEQIEIVVTASRTEEEVTNVPRSVTVIDREEIEQQTRLSRNLTDILGFTVPGLSPSNQNINLFGQNLRGRGVSVLIDGVPQTTNNQGFNRELRTIRSLCD